MPQPLPTTGLTHTKLRRLLQAKLPTAADFDAFCLDFFTSVHRRFSSSMDRMERTTLLLDLVADPLLIVARLREYLEVAEHRLLTEPNLPALAAPELPGQAGPRKERRDDITVRLPQIAPRQSDPPAAFAAPAVVGDDWTVRPPRMRLRQQRAVMGLGLVTIIAGVMLVMWLAGPYSASDPNLKLVHQAPIAESGGPDPQSSPTQPAQELNQVAYELLGQADAEQKSEGSLGLYLTLSTVDALHRVADIFVKKPDLVAAMVLRQLIDRQLQVGLNPRDVDPIWDRVRHATDSGPDSSVEQRRIRAAITDDLMILGRDLRDPDVTVRITATQRFVWSQFSSSMVRQVLLDLYSRRGVAQVLAYGLLRQIGIAVKPPADTYNEITEAAVAQRCVLIAALGQWPAQDAKPILTRIVEQDKSPAARRQAMDSLLEIARRESATASAGSKGNASVADRVVDDMLTQVAQDPDNGLRLRRKYVLARRRTPVPARAPAPAPSRFDWTQGGSVEVTFTGESQVRFSMDNTPYQVPVKLSLPPGPYMFSYVCREGVHRELLMVPRGPTYTKRIPVTRDEQRLRLVK